MCKFCNNSGDHRYTTSDNRIKYFINMFGKGYLRIGITSTILNPQSIQINYCPFCGKKLNKD